MKTYLIDHDQQTANYMESEQADRENREYYANNLALGGGNDPQYGYGSASGFYGWERSVREFGAHWKISEKTLPIICCGDERPEEGH